MIVGQMALFNFPKAPEMLDALADHCEALFLLWDESGDPDLLHYAENHPKTRDVVILHTLNGEPWNRWNWREKMIRQLDDVKPKLVLSLDEDEKYDDLLPRDIGIFMASPNWDLMLFDYAMITETPREVKKYPGGPHCKAFRWIPGITYQPYKGNAIPRTYRADSRRWYRPQTKIQHYCFFTPEMEQAKVLHL